MAADWQRCSYCGERIDGGPPPRGCPFFGEESCTLAVPEAPDSAARSGSLGETVPFVAAEGPTDLEGEQPLDLDLDGFPQEDDLIDRPLGQYRMGSVIGQGSMGRVYRAEHTGLGRSCAIKVMNPGLVSRHPQVLGHFWAEARAVAGLVHPHIVTVHNLGSDRGYHYIEMEYVPGGVSLRHELIRGGPLEPIRATTLVRQVVLALGAAHRAGLIHRDVKPANVLLTVDGRAKLADFGLVGRPSDGSGAGAPVAGTPSFMAPELFAGAAAGPSSDLYAIGVMYYYLLSARVPFAADRLSRLIEMHRRAPVPDVRLVSPTTTEEMATILARCLAKDPASRYSSADDLAYDFESALMGLRNPDEVVREALDGTGGVVSGGQGRYRVLLQLPGGRLQEVHAEATVDRLGHRLLSVYSVCCPAEPGHFEFALRLNAELTYGGLSIREVDGRPMFVMTRAYPDGRASPEEVRAAVLEIAHRSDRVELELTRADDF